MVSEDLFDCEGGKTQQRLAVIHRRMRQAEKRMPDSKHNEKIRQLASRHDSVTSTSRFCIYERTAQAREPSLTPVVLRTRDLCKKTRIAGKGAKKREPCPVLKLGFPGFRGSLFRRGVEKSVL